ncbi:SCO7613 C-terminal domain-containing membrane protein [Streptomyces sp. CA-294286]|uniref:SCO7613 C-terminal domain-containing membrane protein n=1 Tax=Streptomyces sp. CA-294286 TaxID=3240070 RepID=UPI003D91EFCD
MSDTPPLAPAEELLVIDGELARLDARRHQLLLRRAWLLNVLSPRATPPQPSWQPAPAPRASSAPGAQNVLLTLGGILLAVAALAFTLVGWGQLGIAGRAAALAAVTLGALAAPVLLVRRGLTATAEAVGVVGLLLTVLDAYALHEVAFTDVDGTAYTALAAAALAALWAAYGLLLPRLRGPLPAALLSAQLPLPLWAATHSVTALPFVWALLATAALDAAVAVRLLRPPAATADAGSASGTRRAASAGSACAAGTSAPAVPAGASTRSGSPSGTPGSGTPPLPGAAVRDAGPHAPRAAGSGRPLAPLGVLAAFCAWATGGLSLLAALAFSLAASTTAEALRPSGVLLAGAALALAVSLRRPQRATAAVAGLAFVAATAGAVRPALPVAWTVPAYLLCALGVLVSASAPGARLPRAVRHGLRGAASAVGGGAVLTTLPALALTVLAGPLSHAAAPWRGLPATVRETVGGGSEVFGHAMSTAPLVLLAVASALAVVHRRSPHPAAAAGAVLTGAAALLLAPAALHLPYVAALALHVATAAAALLLAARLFPSAAPTAPASAGSPAVPATGSPSTGPGTAPAHSALAAGLVAAGAASCLALASRSTTFAVLGALLAVFGLLGARGPAPVLRAVGSVAAVGCATGLACASAAVLNATPLQAAALVLTVPVAVALLAAFVPRLTGSAVVPAEIAAAGSALLAVGLVVGDLPALATVLGLCGAIVAGIAARPDRRSAGWAAAVLFLLAAWVRLAVWQVAEPEAYTLPVTVLALAAGHLRRRSAPGTSSWTAYGAGLAVTLLPSLVAVWADPYWPRPLLLGCASLGITLLGARYRLGAPLLLGSAVLALVALHELAPYVVQVVGVLPRWLPPALAGLLLLAVGATYERRLHDARRLRERLTRLG